MTPTEIAAAATNHARSGSQSPATEEAPPPARTRRSRETARVTPPPAASTDTGKVPAIAFGATMNVSVATPDAKNWAVVRLTPTPAGNPDTDSTTGFV